MRHKHEREGVKNVVRGGGGGVRNVLQADSKS